MNLAPIESLYLDVVEETDTPEEWWHVVCLPCNGNVSMPIMRALCGSWVERGDKPKSECIVCEPCEYLKEQCEDNGNRCPAGHKWM